MKKQQIIIKKYKRYHYITYMNIAQSKKIYTTYFDTTNLVKRKREKKKYHYAKGKTHIMKKCSKYINATHARTSEGRRVFVVGYRLSAIHQVGERRNIRKKTFCSNPISYLFISFKVTLITLNSFALPSQILQYFQHFVDLRGLGLQFV